MPKIALIGDLHGRWKETYEILDNIEVDFALQVGDYWCYDVEWPVPVYWIMGNHEDLHHYRRIATNDIGAVVQCARNNFWLNRVYTVEVAGVTILPINSVPSSRYAPGPANASVAETTLIPEMNHGKDIDILLSHGAGHFFPCLVDHQIVNCEDIAITNLIETFSPRYAVSGHNHTYSMDNYGSTTCIRLGKVSNTCCPFDSQTNAKLSDGIYHLVIPPLSR